MLKLGACKQGGVMMFEFKKRTKGNQPQDLRISSDNKLWNDILIRFLSLPKKKQDEVLYRIYKNIYTRANPERHLSVLLKAHD
ncbi:MAG: hypothetical protein ACI4NE_07760 [Succinivibrio sp.]